MEITKKELRQRVYISKENGHSNSGIYTFDLQHFFCVWALIKGKTPRVAFMHDSFKSVGDPSYNIYIKKNPTIIITSGAWLIHQPKVSAERHFKVMELFEYSSELLCLACNLIQTKDQEESSTSQQSFPLANYGMDGRL